jgi:hypothetical protein
MFQSRGITRQPLSDLRTPARNPPFSLRTVLRFTIWILPALLLLLATELSAQSVRGRLIDGAARQPIQGALVLLLDESGRQMAGSLSGDGGDFVINAPVPGRYRVRAQRIGFEDASSPIFQLDAGATVQQTLTLTQAAIALDGIAVQARRRCTVRPRDGEILGALWNEARRALHATAFTEGERLYTFEVRNQHRVLEPTSLRVIRDSSVVRQTFGDRSPWVSLPVRQLLTGGFMQSGPEGYNYYAPDAMVLMSDEFLDEYCLGLTASHPDQPGLVGVTFAPLARRGPTGVRGTLWLDRESRELRWFEYSYTRAPSPIYEDHRLGGRVEFEPLPSGAWIVRRWWIRMPFGAVRQGFAPAPLVRAQELFGSIVQEGGEVTEIRSASGLRRTTPMGTLEGVVFDSVRAEPLQNALVFISGTSHSDSTDAEGRFSIQSIPEGRYEVSVTHPELSRFGVRLPPRTVNIGRGETATLEFGVARFARRDAAQAACSDTGTGALHGMLRGRVLDEMTRAPLGRARVTFAWPAGPHGAAGSTTTISAPDGSFLACGLPAEGPVTTRASFMGAQGASVALNLSPDAYMERDLAVGVTRAETVLLTIRDWDSQQPIANAVVSLPDLQQQVVSDASGRVRLEGLLEGEHRIEVRHIGYGTQRDRLTVSEGMTTLEMRLSPQAIAIEGVRVVARSAAEEARRRSGSRQSLLIREDIAALTGAARHVGDIARRLPGIRVRDIVEINSSIPTGICIESSRGTMREPMDGCSEPVMVVLNGVPIFDPSRLVQISTTEIESIEYLSSAEAGGRFGWGSAQGVIIIYTRGNGPYARAGDRRW